MVLYLMIVCFSNTTRQLTAADIVSIGRSDETLLPKQSFKIFLRFAVLLHHDGNRTPKSITHATFDSVF